MKKGYRTTAAILTAALMMSAAAGCTKKTAVDGTSDPSASDSAQSPVESAGSELPGDIIDTVPTDFDIHDYTFDTVYGSQLPEYVERQYYFNGEEVPIAESNFYFVNAFLELTEYAAYGYYPVTEDNFLDLSAAIDYGDDEQGEFETYGDLFNQYSERMLASTCTICKLAREQGLELSQETLDAIDSMIAGLEENQAEPNGVTLDEYLKLYYGESCDAEAFRQVMINYYLADLFTTQYIDNYEFSDEQIAEYSYPLVRYALFSAPADTATEEDLEVAREYAEALVEEAAGDLDDFYNLGQAAFEAGTCAQCSDISVPVGRTVPAFEEWAWDEARTEGEIGVIYAPEYGYFAVGYLGVELDEDAVSQIAVGDLGDYVSSLIGTEGYFLSTDPDATPAPAATAASSEPSETEESSDPSESEAGETVADETGSEATEEAA